MILPAQPAFLMMVLSAGTLTATVADEADYQRDIAPILAVHCYACHGPHAAEVQAGLRLDLPEVATRPADSGQTAIVPGQPEESELIRRILAEDDAQRMPPPASHKQLTPNQKELLVQWIARGAKYEQHWSFLPPQRPIPPGVRDNDDWVVNPIDRFVLAQLLARGMEPSPEASRATLVRRVSLDVRGLPPSIDELDQFLNDNAPDAYSRMVARMLDTPQFGEKMTLVWMDLARYGDTNGFHSDSIRPAWIWREWVIAAYNDNMPFDQFTIEQLAGDLLPAATVEQKVASGFNRNSTFNEEGGADPDEWRVHYAVDRTKTLGRVWLGLTLDCAQCHSHKYDPISQQEFFQLYAFFNSLEEIGAGGASGFHYKPVPPVIQVPRPGQVEAVEAATAKVEAIEKQIHDQLKASRQRQLKAGELAAWMTTAAEDNKVPQQVRDAIQLDEANRSAEQLREITDYYRQHVDPQTRDVFDPLLAQLESARQEQAKAEEAIPIQLVSVELSDPRPAHVLIRGDFQQPGPRVERGVPAILPSLPSGAPRDRLALARWLVDPQHPLTARVTVNRYWAQLFARGIVETVADFGQLGRFPTHPQLLDWLAVEFVESAWDTKHILTLILTSATYRQSSVNDRRYDQIDPANRWLSRAPRFRLQAEEIRDNALRISGLLHLAVGGPGVFPFQPPDYFKGKHERWEWNLSQGTDRYRRGMYTFWRRTTPYPAFMVFDAPDRCESVAVRPRTNTPLQALVTMNEPQFVEAGRAFGRRIMETGGSSADDRLVFAFRACVARQPEDNEFAVLREMFDERLQYYQENREAAARLADESAEDQAVAQLAAWTFLGNTLLNLDETITRE